ncbi:MAG: 3-isopropylmalate dehydratase [Thermodesulfobacteriota bacterium]|nr:3-isopropylmalate dehydratase [Thermodesulfobacteriota bacterium]
MREIKDMPKLEVMRGKVWRFGDNISTTDITPDEMFMGVPHTLREIVFAAIKPDWKEKVEPGDCIVGGKNFGLGSHRAIAIEVMKDLGIRCIVADSIARIYYRTSIAMGFPVFPCPGVSEIFDEGNELELDIHKGLVKNLTTGKIIQGKPYPQQLLEILEAGGMMSLLVERARKVSPSSLKFRHKRIR